MLVVSPPPSRYWPGDATVGQGSEHARGVSCRSRHVWSLPRKLSPNRSARGSQACMHHIPSEEGFMGQNFSVFALKTKTIRDPLLCCFFGFSQGPSALLTSVSLFGGCPHQRPWGHAGVLDFLDGSLLLLFRITATD